jgi:hypothetical protein
MKLGSKRTKQAELLDALGGEAFIPDELAVSLPSVHAPAAAESAAQKNPRGNLPVISAER